MSRKRDREVYFPVVSKRPKVENATEYLSRNVPSVMAVKRSSRYKRRTGRRYRRRFYRRIGRTLTPYSITRTLKTVIGGVTLDGGAAGAIAMWKLKLNSAFDPTGDINSQQPMGFDQYSALYQRCAVVKWFVKVELASTDNTYPIVVGCTPIVSATALTTYSHYKEQPGTVSVLVTPDVDKNKFTCRGGVKRFFLPKSASMLADDTITHGVTGDPSRLLYLHLWAQDLAITNDVANVRAIVTLYQTVVFYVPEVPARS